MQGGCRAGRTSPDLVVLRPLVELPVAGRATVAGAAAQHDQAEALQPPHVELVDVADEVILFRALEAWAQAEGAERRVDETDPLSAPQEVLGVLLEGRVEGGPLPVVALADLPELIEAVVWRKRRRVVDERVARQHEEGDDRSQRDPHAPPRDQRRGAGERE